MMWRRSFIRAFSGLIMLAIPFLIEGGGANPAHANPDPIPRLTPQITATLHGLSGFVLSDPLLLSVLRDAERARREPDEIIARERQWRQEAAPGKGPLIDGILNGPPSRELEKLRLGYGTLLADMMLIDADGLLAAVTHLTSDYIQVDEAKYLETFSRGAGAIHIESPHYDESAQNYVITASIALGDPADGRPLGVLTININMEMLEP